MLRKSHDRYVARLKQPSGNQTAGAIVVRHNDFKLPSRHVLLWQQAKVVAQIIEIIVVSNPRSIFDPIRCGRMGKSPTAHAEVPSLPLGRESVAHYAATGARIAAAEQ